MGNLPMKMAAMTIGIHMNLENFQTKKKTMILSLPTLIPVKRLCWRWAAHHPSNPAQIKNKSNQPSKKKHRALPNKLDADLNIIKRNSVRIEGNLRIRKPQEEKEGLNPIIKEEP